MDFLYIGGIALFPFLILLLLGLWGYCLLICMDDDQDD